MASKFFLQMIGGLFKLNGYLGEDVNEEMMEELRELKEF